MASTRKDLEALVKEANAEASRLALDAEPGTDARDHLMQAHFRLTEALAHVRVARRAIASSSED